MQDRRQSIKTDFHRRRGLLVMLGIASGGVLLTQTGCIPFVANIIHAVKGDEIPAEYAGLKKQTVALITVTDTSQYSNDIAAKLLTRYVNEILKLKVKDIKLIREDEVEQWRDTQGYNEIDYVSLGRGVKADKVVSVEMTNLRLRDGQTMYRGHADVTVAVRNVADGSLEFRRSLDDYTYPVTAAMPVTETTEDKFRRIYLANLGAGLLFQTMTISEIQERWQRRDRDDVPSAALMLQAVQ